MSHRMGAVDAQRVFLVGTGSAGTALGLWLSQGGHELVGAWNRSAARARWAAEFLGVPIGTGRLEAIPRCDLVLVAVSDDSIHEVGVEIRNALRPGMVVVHTSGSLPAAALGDQAVPRGSMHPLVAMRDPRVAAKALPNALFVLEGEQSAVDRSREFVNALHAEAQVLESHSKVHYHAAAVIAANLAVSLVAEAAELASTAGVKNAEHAFAQLALVALENVTERGAAAGLTGPVARGDSGTVRSHLEHLEGETREIYRLLSRRALRLARRLKNQRGLDDDRLDALETLLEQ